MLAILAIFVAAPLVLARAARSRFGSANPLADIAPPWRWSLEEIGDVVSEPLRDDAVVNLLIRSSLTIIWLALATVAITIVLEVIHMVRHRGMASPRIRGLGWAQRIARWIAVGIVALLPLGSFGSVATANEQPLSPAATAERFVEPAIATPFGTDTSPTAGSPTTVSSGDEYRSPLAPADADAPGGRPDLVAPAAGDRHLVERGESIYGIAGDYAAGDAERTNEVANAMLDLNLGEVMNDGERFTNPALIQPGWELRLPAGIAATASSEPLDNVPAATGFDDSDDNPTPVRGIPRVDATSGAPDSATHVVVAGDTLSDIAQDRLGDQDAWPEIWEENAGDEMGDGRTFDDPNLIVPGWELDIPTDEAPEPPARDAVEPAGTIDHAREHVPPEQVLEPMEVPGTEVPERITPAAEPASPMPPSTPPSTPSAPTTTVPATSGPGAQPDSSGWSEPAPSAPSPVRLEHAALLAAGVLTLVGVRRRRALRAALPHARVPTPAPEIAATERRLRTIDAGERAARVDIAMRAIAHRITGSGTMVGTVRIAPDGELIARLTQDARLEAPWVCDAEVGQRQTWTLPASVPIEMLSDDARQSGQPCIALVTVGVDADGRGVLIDLEAAGLTTIEATPEQGDEVVRAIGSGLATSLPSEVAHLLVAKLGTDALFDHPNARALTRCAETVDAAARTVGSTLENDRSAFDLRSRRTGGEMWEPAIILLAHADDAAHSLPTLPAVGHGIAAVAAVDPGGFDERANNNAPGARVQAHHDGWELLAFGESIQLTPIGLSPTDVGEIAAILDDASTPIDAVAPSRAPVDDTVADAVAGPIHIAPHDIIVNLMGGVSVVDTNGESGEFQRSKTLELIAWLATHREQPTRSAARTALWELDVRDATFANVVSEARRALGRLVPPPDGDEWVGRTLTESLPLHERVVSDADLIRQRVKHAQVAPPAHAIDVLRPAVQMINGLPFAGSSYLWPDADGLTSNLVLLATTAASELAAHALSVGDTELVFWSTGQGLKVLPGHEELIALRMRAHARSGDLSGVRQEWESYERVITADAWSDGEPAPKLLDLRRELLTSPN